ncbi:MAG TPA: DUF2007 domain-containing protein [Anaeromyxobacteraceae bacterium]|nr:DUF2007 domain-containing protein [Anaeromyxobacteraceae bacterium]
MADRLREHLLATFADRGAAMVIESVLEANGVPCRVGDVAGIPAHMLGIAGAAGRSVGVWVLEQDAERATSLLATMEAPGSGVDEEALAAEAMAAPPPHDTPEPGQVVAPARASPPVGRAGRSPWPRAVFASLAVLAALAAWRGCR